MGLLFLLVFLQGILHGDSQSKNRDSQKLLFFVLLRAFFANLFETAIYETIYNRNFN